MSGSRQTVVGCMLVVLFGFVPLSRAKTTIPAAPIPIQITQAKTIFISNAGQESDPSLGIIGHYRGGPARLYNQFYGALKNWGQYKILLSPTDADLVFQIRFTDSAKGSAVLSGQSLNTPDYATPKIRLVIFDAKTHVILWAFSEYIRPAILPTGRDKNFDAAIKALMNDLQQLTTSSSAPTYAPADSPK